MHKDYEKGQRIRFVINCPTSMLHGRELIGTVEKVYSVSCTAKDDNGNEVWVNYDEIVEVLNEQ